MIKFVSGDVLQTASRFIAQGVAIGTPDGMGTGLALQISSKWPEAQKHFKQFTRSQNFQGGDIFVVAPKKNRPGIIYVATQPDVDHASLSFLNRGLRKLARYCVKNQIESVSVPKIGTGLDKLDWEEEVKPLLVKHLDDLETNFLIYEDFKREYESS